MCFGCSKKHLIEFLLLSTHNICFGWEIRKKFQLRTLIWGPASDGNKSFLLYFSVLNSKWKEKSQLIGQLEEQVREMKESWDRKEVKLTQERDKALDAAK